MPEPAVVEAPAATEKMGGIDSMLGKMFSTTEPSTPEPAKADPAPAKAEPARAEPAKSEPARPDPAKPEPAKAFPAAKPDDLWEKAPPKLKNQYFQLKRETDERAARLEKQVKDFEAKLKEPSQAPDAKLLEKYQAEVKQWQERAAAADYRQSVEFQKNHQEKINAEYANALEELKNIKVITGKNEETGAINTRPATKEDFDKLFNLRGSDQDEEVERLFGKSSFRVMARVQELLRLDRAATNAVAEHAKNFELTQKESIAKSEKEYKDYERHFSQSKSEIEEKWPDYFKPDEKDAEISGALKESYDHSDKLIKSILDAKNSPPEDRAASLAVLRARSAALAPTILKLNRALEKIKQMEGERSKTRKSDPGDGESNRTGGAPGEGDKIPKGIEEASKLMFGNV